MTTTSPQDSVCWAMGRNAKEIGKELSVREEEIKYRMPTEVNISVKRG